MESPFDNLFGLLKQETSQSNLKKTVGDIIQLNSPEIIKLVKNRLKYGQGVNGGNIGGDKEKANFGYYKNYEYAQKKHEQNPLAGFGNVDLFLTGSLSDDITVIRKDDKFEILSTDKKYERIANKYGAEEFGLTEEQLQEFLHECYLLSLETIIKNTYGK